MPEPNGDTSTLVRHVDPGFLVLYSSVTSRHMLIISRGKCCGIGYISYPSRPLAQMLRRFSTKAQL